MSEISGRLGGPTEPEPDDTLPAGSGVDHVAARWLRRHMATNVVVVTARVEDRFRAATVGSCMSASIDPPQILVSLDTESRMHDWLLASSSFGISVLGWEQQLLADRFAGLVPLVSASFAGIDHFFAVTGAPLLSACIAWADCVNQDTLLTGDHRCFLGNVVALGSADGNADNPLVYYGNRYRRLR